MKKLITRDLEIKIKTKYNYSGISHFFHLSSQLNSYLNAFKNLIPINTRHQLISCFSISTYASNPGRVTKRVMQKGKSPFGSMINHPLLVSHKQPACMSNMHDEFFKLHFI